MKEKLRDDRDKLRAEQKDQGRRDREFWDDFNRRNRSADLEITVLLYL